MEGRTVLNADQFNKEESLVPVPTRRDVIVDGQIERVRLEAALRHLVQYSKANPAATVLNGLCSLIRSDRHSQPTVRALGEWRADRLLREENQ